MRQMARLGLRLAGVGICLDSEKRGQKEPHANQRGERNADADNSYQCFQHGRGCGTGGTRHAAGGLLAPPAVILLQFFPAKRTKFKRALRTDGSLSDSRYSATEKLCMF
jgi:hypothetical protein